MRVSICRELPDVLLMAVVQYVMDWYDVEDQCDGMDGCNNLHHAINTDDAVSTLVFMEIAKAVEETIKSGVKRYQDVHRDALMIINEGIRTGRIKHEPIGA